MTRPARRDTTAGTTAQTTPRHFWLAALGALSVARRQAIAATRRAAGETGALQAQAIRFAGDARDVARGVAITLQETLAQRMVPGIARVKTQVEARVARAVAPKPAARRTVRTARKPAKAKQASRRSPGARQQATRRVARKGRG